MGIEELINEIYKHLDHPDDIHVLFLHEFIENLEEELKNENRKS